MRELWLIRHGETDWSAAWRHTGRTDRLLTAKGEAQAASLKARLAPLEFSMVRTSPLRRASDTCAHAGLRDAAVVDPDLREWDYGDYEGRTTAQIRLERAEWDLWNEGVPQGETVEQVGARADRVLAAADQAQDRVALFAHGHLLRVLAARWLGLEARAGRLFTLEPASVSLLGFERERHVLHRWNDVGHLPPGER